MAGVDRRLCAYGGAACTGQRAYVGTLVSRLPPRPEIQRARSACVIRTLRVRARAKRSGCATVAQARRCQCGGEWKSEIRYENARCTHCARARLARGVRRTAGLGCGQHTGGRRNTGAGCVQAMRRIFGFADSGAAPSAAFRRGGSAAQTRGMARRAAYRMGAGAMKMTLYLRRCIATGLEKRLRSRPRCKFYWAIQWANSAHTMPRRIAPLSAAVCCRSADKIWSKPARWGRRLSLARIHSILNRSAKMQWMQALRYALPIPRRWPARCAPY